MTCCDGGWISVLEPYPERRVFDRERGREVVHEQGRVLAEGPGLVAAKGQSIEQCPNPEHQERAEPCLVLCEGLVHIVSRPCPTHRRPKEEPPEETVVPALQDGPRKPYKD